MGNRTQVNFVHITQNTTTQRLYYRKSIWQSAFYHIKYDLLGNGYEQNSNPNIERRHNRIMGTRYDHTPINNIFQISWVNPARK